MENSIISSTEPNLIKMLEVLTPKVKLSDVRIGKNFQFAGDRVGVRNVIAVDGEYAMLKTLGHPNESGTVYAVHYSHLYPNNSPVWDDWNNIRELWSAAGATSDAAIVGPAIITSTPAEPANPDSSETPTSSLRNKLTPFFNLVAMTLTNGMVFENKNEELIRLAMAEARQCDHNKVIVEDLIDQIENVTAVVVNTSTVVTYSQKGHYMYPEDTWSDSTTCDNVKELIGFIIACHKHDAGNHNDFPLSGSLDGRFTFEKVTITTYDHKGKILSHRESEPMEKPEYFIEAMERYNALIRRARITLPKMRELREARKERANNLKTYKKLKDLFDGQQ